MKLNIVKYFFILFVVGIIGFAIYNISYKEDEKQEQNEVNTVTDTYSQILTNLRLGIADFDTINPLVTKNKEVINLSVLIFDSLLTIDEEYKINTQLAKEWSKTSNTTYIIKLQENLKWQDGTRVTAKDIQFTIDRLKEGKSVYSANVTYVKSVEIVDETTIKINLSKEVPFFEYNLTFPILSNEQYKNEKDFFKSKLKPMGTGMYKISEVSSDVITLEKNENWNYSTTQVRKIENIKIYLYSSMGEVYNSFKIGNIDLLNTSSLNINDYIGTIGFNTKEYKGREYDYLAFNCEDSILKYKEVRQAINYAIDRKSIISSIFNNGYYEAYAPLDYGNYLYVQTNNKTQYNQKSAKKVLEDAGWEYKYGTWQKTENYITETINITLTVNTEDEQRVKVAEFIEEQLEDIGIHVYINEVYSTTYNNYLKNKNYEMILTGMYNSYSPDLSTYFAEGNIFNYKNEEIQALIKEVKNISSEDLLKEKYNKILEIYSQDIPFASLYRNKNTVVYSKKLMGEISPNNYTIYHHFANWYRN